jgi:hypothetical protein
MVEESLVKTQQSPSTHRCIPCIHSRHIKTKWEGIQREEMPQQLFLDETERNRTGEVYLMSDRELTIQTA